MIAPSLDLRVVVAGGGALGATAALTLARRGAAVTLVDPGRPGENASGVAAGMLAPAFESILDSCTPEFPLLRRARDLWPDLAASIGLTIDKSGAMAIGEAATIDVWMRNAEALCMEVRCLSPSAANERAPWLTWGQAAIWTSEDWRLDPLDALAAIKQAAEKLGARWTRGTVGAFEPGRAELADGRVVECDALLIATGMSLSLETLAPELGVLRPIKGHILRFPSLSLSGPVVRLQGAYICPAAGGAVVGSTMEAGRDDIEIDPAAAGRLRALAAAAAPEFLTAPLQARAGVRAAAPDGLPLVGRAGAGGVWLAVGARRNGWLLAPLAARMIADDMAGAQRSADADEFDPGRFRVRA